MSIFCSKKFLMVIIGTIVVALRANLAELQGQDLFVLLAPIFAYLAGQSMADWGKGALSVTDGNGCDGILSALADLVQQKKAQATFLAILIAFVHQYFPQVDDASLQAGIALLTTYVIGQGMADIGKSVALIKDGD